MQGIKLNLINNSNDTNNSEIVIFQKNEATSYDETAIAWTVIQYFGKGDNHPFTFSLDNSIGASDSWGNYTPQLDAQNGESFHMILSSSGDVLEPAGAATSAKEVQLRNDLPKGAINALIYKDGKLLATKTGISPGQKAVFQFSPTIWIGVVSQVEQGEVINSAIISNVNTQLSLLGIASADIVMTGGGPGPNSQPFTFSLENIVYA